ncbi:relaxase [Paracoccus sp. M683]|uniref:relaxase/mobilization nuclease domain-containing protein n=1 Tax=Paracoccus sp. M683 TaxID=2594268 RepID=UPI001180F405|nr:relaxase/mobilization nuclease domain-containing protein [Paracoccus sp. M683]TRW95221.1 relaxase [Paracoccus sp. M683]
MILKGSQRGGALKLAVHLLNERDNDHVELHDLRGFTANDLREAFREIEAVAKGTKCRQPLFSLSFNPPETERVGVPVFLEAIEEAETRLGLNGQARAIIFHEKEGRRHAHVVWSRIDVQQMKAVNLPFFKNRLNGLAKELFLEYGWRLPDGFRDHLRRNPLNFTLQEWQQAQRGNEDARDLKLRLRECWSVSDNRAAFEHALEDQGFVLAKGDRRGFVAVDMRGEVYSLSRWTGVKAKELESKIGQPDGLPTVGQAKERIASRMTEKLRALLAESEQQAAARQRDLQTRKDELKDAQRRRRRDLADHQDARAKEEAVIRAARFRKGIGGVWDWLSGKTRKTKLQNEAEARAARERDARDREALITAQLSERRVLQNQLRELRNEARDAAADLRLDLAHYLGFRDRPSEGENAGRKTSRRRRDSSRETLSPER